MMLPDSFSLGSEIIKISALSLLASLGYKNRRPGGINKDRHG